VVERYVREVCRQAWNVPVVDTYSSQEVGYIALQCPTCERYHVQAENVFVEILREDGTSCSHGEVGRVVVTTLHNYATPLIRYAIGDYAEVGEPCSCGRGLPVLNRILGRQRNMLVLPHGDQRWPVFDIDLRNREPRFLSVVRQMQVVQRTLDQIDVSLVTARRLDNAEESSLRQHIESALGGAFRIRLHYVASIPRSHTGKFEDFRSDVGERVCHGRDALLRTSGGV